MILQTKSVEDENRRLKQIFVKLTMRNELLKDAFEPEIWHRKPSRR